MSTKVLYISNYFDSTGWGNASLMNILALDAAGVRVVPRSITYNNRAGINNVPHRIFELEQDDLSNIDVCIQHTLPTSYVYRSNCKQIGMYESETDMTYSGWHKYINLMDEAWVPNNFSALHSLPDVTIPIKVAPHAIDIEKFRQVEKVAELGELTTTFNFCFIGEMVARKGISNLLTAFHLAFHPSEPVNLFLKLNAPGVSSDKARQELNKLNDRITTGLRIRKKYKDPVLITGMLPEKQLHSLMKQCHCFVSASYGEAWCIPALEAMACGMDVIYPQNSGTADFALGYSYNTRTVPCFGAVDALPEIYTGFDCWEQPDILDLVEAMRSRYFGHRYAAHPNHSKEALFAQAAKYDYRVIGHKLKELL